MFSIRSLNKARRYMFKVPESIRSAVVSNPSKNNSFIRHRSTAPINPKSAAAKRLKTPIESYIPPIALLESGKKAGALNIEPLAAQNLLRKYAESSINKLAGGNWEKQFFEDEGVTPQTLTILSLIVGRSADPPRKSLGKRLLLCASRLGDPTATLFIMTSALDAQTTRNPEYAPVFAHLKSLTQLPHENHAAMVLLGRIHAAENQDEKALQLFRRVAGMKVSAKEANPILQSSSPIADALIAQGLILQKRGDSNGAEGAFRTAALEHDNPSAYYHLAQLLGPGSISSASTQSKYETYLLKASSSGIPDAAAQLGKLYHERAVHPKEETGEKRILAPWQAKLAKEWLYLAAAAGNVGCMTRLAEILQLEGDVAAAEAWVERAGNEARIKKDV